jgi:20S proteasome alpha/beta subunit
MFDIVVGVQAMRAVVLLLLTFAAVCTGSSDHDLSLHLYTETGEVAQVSYAAAAIQRSAAKVVFHDKDLGFITMLSICRRKPLLCTRRMKSVEAIRDLPLVCISAGYSPDCRYLLNQFNQLVQNHCFLYGESPNAEYVKHHLSRWMTRGMYDGGEDQLSRPLAAAVAIAAHDQDTNTNKLVEIHNNGYADETKLALLGGLPPQSRQKITALFDGTQPAALLPSTSARARWVERCQQCLDILSDASKGSTGGGGEDEDAFCVECCVVDAAGALHQPLNDQPSVAATVDWLQSLPSP